jgi:hypothetical protein
MHIQGHDFRIHTRWCQGFLSSRPTVPLNGRTVDRICPVRFDEGSSASSASILAAAAAAFAGAALRVVLDSLSHKDVWCHCVVSLKE